MSRDYKSRAQKKPSKKPVPGWLWLLTGALLGGLVVSLFWLQGLSQQPGGEWVGSMPDRPPQGAAEKAARKEVQPPPKPRFDFYNMLPKMEVVVPDDELDVESTVTPTKATAGNESANYLIQVGSFRRTADADRLKAQLALLGFEATVETARLNGQDTRYRVRTGPYRGVDKLNVARTRLAENGFSGIVIRTESQ